MAESRNPDELARGLARLARRSRRRCARRTQRFVELANQGARDLGFADIGALWRSGYDMPPEAFAAEIDRLWQQVKPLYTLAALLRAPPPGREVRRRPSCRPRARSRRTCSATCGRRVGERLPAGRAATRAAPPRRHGAPEGEEGRRAADGALGEGFFTSLGLAAAARRRSGSARSSRSRADREVVCHASAWDVDNEHDLRIKMCIEPNEEDLVTIHHELGHNFYQHAYRKLPFLFQQRRQRRLPRGDRRHDRALGDAGVPEEGRPARQAARRRPGATSRSC